MSSPTSSGHSASGYTPSDAIRGRILWHECLTTDSDAARRFYSAVFGWGEARMPMGDGSYVMWTVDGDPRGGFFPMPEDVRAQGAPQHWMTYFGIPDVDAGVAQVTQAGGTVMVPPHDIPDVGRFAVLADPQGAMFALYTPLDVGPGSPDMPPIGDASWHELATADSVAAREFYGALFGWESLDDIDMGDGMMYRMFARGGVPLGGMFDITEQMPMPPNWVPYFRVADITATIAAVQANGGTLMNGPQEVPGGDLVAQFTDPQGGYFCGHETKMV